MTTPQRPIGSGHTARSTTADVLAGVDLSGRLAVVTGGYSGLGLATTRALAAAGARVVVPARRPDAARQALAGLDRVETAALDLGDLGGIRRFAEHLLDSEPAVHLLVNSAGIMACPESRVGPGWEAQFAVNHLGHHALTGLLWPALANGGARVVAVSSGAHHGSPIRWHDIHFTTGYDRWLAYAQSKTANVLFATHLDRLGRGSGVRAFAVHPGAILTPLQRHISTEDKIANGWIHTDGSPADPSFKTVEQGAATQVWAATAPSLAGRGGVYCEDCDIAEVATGDGGGGVRGHAIDPDQAARLWTHSAELTGVDPV